MSGSIGLSSDPFTDAERTDIRRFCGYDSYGGGNSGFNSQRFYTAYGVLEFKLSNFAPAEFQVVRQYLGQLYLLESAVPAAGDNLDTDIAAVWTRNRNEVGDRERLLTMWGRKLAGFIGVPPGPAFQDIGGRITI